jgi:outer membrane biosynthesis protein TonB
MALADARLLPPPPPARSEGRALALATLAHVALIAVASLGWHWTSRPLPPANEPIPIDFVDIADVPRTPDPPQPSLEAAPQESAPPPAIEPLPVPDIPEPEPKPEPKPQPKPEPQPLDTATLSNLIDKALPKAKTKPLDTSSLAKTIAAAQPKNAKIDPRAAATLAQAIRAQVAPCWNPPIGGEDVRKMTVLIAADYNRDGSLAAAPRIVSQTGKTASNTDYARAFAETAVRAVQRCQPLKLPADLYSLWKSVEINFDPETMT